ncbi:MAG: hypothetical protein AAFU70_11650, partial [Planctomycetota bacterium]
MGSFAPVSSEEPPIAFGPAQGALLFDFMRWREKGGPKGGAQLLAHAKGWWCFSAFGFLLSPKTKRELCAV